MEMNLEKIFYIVASTVLVTLFVLIVFIFSPVSYDERLAAGEKVIYYADNISPAHEKIIAKFNNLFNGKIRVETINLPFEKFSTNERKELLARYLRSNSSRIDIFSVDVIWVPRFSRWALPLENLIDSTIVNAMLPFTLQTCKYKDSLVALPLYVDIALMFYRDDILKKLPDYVKISEELSHSITWERFEELKYKLDRAADRINKPFYYFQADSYEGLICSFFELIMNQNNPILTEDGKLLLTDNATRKSISFLQNLVHKSRISPQEVTKIKENESYELFFSRDAFAVRGWPGFMSKTNKAFRDEYRSLVKAAPLPHLAGSVPSSVFGGWNLMISKFSNNVPEVVKFITFMLQEENQKLLFEEGYLLPANRKIYDDNAFVTRFPELLFYEQLFASGKYRPMFEDYTGVSDILADNINRAIKYNTDIDDVMRDIESQLQLK